MALGEAELFLFVSDRCHLPVLRDSSDPKDFEFGLNPGSVSLA